MKTILKFKLNPKYRDPISIEAEESIFKGRESEINRFRDLIKWRKSASVLVGGTRGVGKTSFVREGLRLVKTEDKKNFPVVELTFANLDVEEKYLRRDVLKALIRGLYLNNIAREAGGELGKLLDGLYNKSYYLELKETGLLEVSKQEKVSREEKETEEKTWSLDSWPLRVLFKVGGTSFVLYSLFELIKLLQISHWLQALLILLFVGGPITFLIMSKFEFKTSFTFFRGFEDKIDEKLRKSGIAKYDLSADTLESGLRQALQQLSESGNKVVFVIDELDKLDDESKLDQAPDQKLTSPLIYRIIRCLKNLFSLSDAIFIFITSAEFYDLIESQKQLKPYSTFHTLFTDKIFLPPLYYKDVENIIDGFVYGKIDEQYKENYEKFKRFISWKAKNHIFDTHNLIEGYTIHEGDGTMEVHVYLGDELRKGNIEEDWEKVAALQNYIAVIYDEKSYPGESRKNEKLYLTLREACNVLHRDNRIEATEVVDNKFLETIEEEERKRLEIDKLDENTQQDLDGAIEDLLLRTERFDFTDFTEEDRTMGDPPETKKIAIYSIKENYAYPVLGKIKEKARQASFEKDFLKKLNVLGKLKDNLSKVGIATFETYEKEYEAFLKSARLIEQEIPLNRKRKSEILNDIDRIDQINSAARLSVLRDLIQSITSELQLNAHGVGTSPSTQPMWEVDPELSSFYNYINDNLKETENYIILSKNDIHVLVGYNMTQSIQDEYIKILLNTRRIAKTKIINIIYGETTNKARQWRVFNLNEGFRDLNALKNEIKNYFK